MSSGQWQFWVDRGGTFTDVIARAPDGAVTVRKLLSVDPERYEDATIHAIRALSGVTRGPLPPAELRIGTTVATNALLERRGEPVLLAITRGFGDALRIGYQERPELFVRAINVAPPLYHEVAEIDERIGADGSIVSALDEATAHAALSAAYNKGLRAIAIVLMHGFRYQQHERQLAEIARVIGFTQISVSHQVAPLIKLIGRGDTTVADAYLSPVLSAYSQSLAAGVGPDVDLLFMQSNGGLTPRDTFHGKDAILSGPAGGIVGMARTAAQIGIDHIIGFDMGGTSTDVSHYAGRYERDSETIVAGARIRAPMMRIHTVAAGGGSVCRFHAGRFQVGPESAGAVPGPACYRRGGPLTITDCNLMLGKIQPDHFPHLFGQDGNLPLDRGPVEQAFATLVADVAAATGQTLSAEEAAEGFVTIAVANMANAIKAISVARGHDVTSYTLMCFGGAAGQHACLVAAALGIERIMIHPLAGILSAYGMGLAERRLVREATLSLPLTDTNMPAIDAQVGTLVDTAIAALSRQIPPGLTVTSEARLFLRHAGAETSIDVAYGPQATMAADAARLFLEQFGYENDAGLIAEMIRVEAIAGDNAGALITADLPGSTAPPIATARCFLAGRYQSTPVHDRKALAPGARIAGPAIIVDPVSTTVIEPGWCANVDAIGNLLLSRTALPDSASASGKDIAVDPVRLEIFNGLFMAIAEEMGAALQRSATSVNIRERLDFSCALFDGEGHLVANAPHMPVHLGSMGESVRTILTRRAGTLRPGDAYVLNAPYDGGTHLPDITVIMPVFLPDEAKPAYYVAARGHHADVGGITPGSMPPNSRSVEEEGVLLDNVTLVESGRLCEAELRARLGSGRWPSRNIDQNIADLKAQIAACTKGASELQRISCHYGAAVVRSYMAHVQDNAEAIVRGLIGRLADGHFAYPMDNGAVVAVSVTVDRDRERIDIDFSGSSAQLADNFNAPLPVVRAAVLYVIRTLIDDPIPMNEGCLRPVNIIVPEGSMLCPRYPAAVVAGNVETSQVITDALFGALGAMAGAQGTMNNFTFGNDRYQYYETIAGGAGAGPGFAGASAIQTHMTNSRLTDPEILESRFPVRLEAFAIRQGSGGNGQYCGGDGVIRKLRFLEAMEAGILANRREVAPFGLRGGGNGATGRTFAQRGDGSIEMLGAVASTMMAAGDMIVIETPGGGGYGEPD